MATQMNNAQRVLRRNYCNGQFDYCDTKSQAIVCGDGLFTFLWQELSDADCNEPNEALRRVTNAERELHDVARVFAEKTVSGSLEHTMRLYIEMSAPEDYFVTGPSYAWVDVTRAWLDKITRLKGLCRDYELSESRAFDSPDYWHGNDEDCRLDCTELVVTSDCAYFSAFLKHTSIRVETIPFHISAITDCFDTGHKVFYCAQCDTDDFAQIVEGTETEMTA